MSHGINKTHQSTKDSWADFNPEFSVLKNNRSLMDQALLIAPESYRFESFPGLSKLLGGLRQREFTIFAGSTGSGKTQLLAALCVDLARNNLPIYVASVETGKIDFLIRMASCQAKKNWNLGEVIPAAELETFYYENAWFNEAPIYLAHYEDRVDIESVLLNIKYAVEKHGVKFAIIDNLNFVMEVTSSANQLLEMDRVAHKMVIFAKQTDVHLVCVMHPRKTDNSRVLSEFDIKGSSTAVQEAHNVLLWNRLEQAVIDVNPSYYKRFREMRIVKCRRNGMAVGSHVTFFSPDGVSYEERTIGTHESRK